MDENESWHMHAVADVEVNWAVEDVEIFYPKPGNTDMPLHSYECCF
jgi:hypothetical protein